MSGRSRFRLSASARVLIAMTAMVAVAVIVLVTIAYFATVRAITAETNATLEAEAQAFSAAVNGARDSESLAEVTRAYLEARTVSGSGRDVVLLVAFDNGRRLSNSQIRLEDASGNSAIARTPAFSRIQEVTLDGVTYRLLAAPVRSQGNVVGVFEAAIAMSALDETTRGIALTLTAAGLLALALVLPLAYWATRASLRPLRQMAADAEEISHANPGRRIAYEGPDDELGSLAETLNAMLTRLEAAFEDQKRFIADASHELRTPVAVIRGNVELLRDGRLDDAEEKGSLKAIEDESVRMSRLLDELLSLARFDGTREPTLQPLYVATLLEEAAARCRALGDRRVVLDAGCDAWIEGDPDLLEQALANLARNAVAHTESGGVITFSCRLHQALVEISVSDDGPGIPTHELERVFDRFYRAGSSRSGEDGSGSGLGLAIARRIVELHGGSISAENVDPHGARFTIALAVSQETDSLA